MPWLLIADIAAGALVAAGIGWPWGVAAVAGCLVITAAAVWVLGRLTVVRGRAGRPSREPLRVIAVRLAPEVGARKVLPGTAEDVTRK